MTKKLHEYQSRREDFEYETRMTKLKNIIEKLNVLKKNIMRSEPQVCLHFFFVRYKRVHFGYFVQIRTVDFVYKTVKQICHQNFVELHDFVSVADYFIWYLFVFHCSLRWSKQHVLKHKHSLKLKVTPILP